MKMTNEQEQQFISKIKYVEEGIKKVEKQIGKTVFRHWNISGDNDHDYVSFYGEGLFAYDIPYEIFMALTPKELVIEIMRALTIEFNEYENE